MSDQDLVPIGFIRAAQGLQGAVLIHAWSGNPDSLISYGALQDATGENTFSIQVAGVKNKDFICRIKGVSDRNAAEALRGIKLFLPAAKLPATADDEFYHRDLIGLSVENADGETIGVVRNVTDFNHSDALLIEFTDRDPPQSEYVLFSKENVPYVSITEKRIVVNVPEGLFD
jgi:16S rRNA processing protein RimM